MYYTLRERTILNGPDKGKTKQYATFRHSDKMKADATLKWLATHCRMGEGDIIRVLYNLEVLLTTHLPNGTLIELPPLGSFQLQIKSPCMEPAAPLPRNRLKATIRFHPGKRLRLHPENIRLKKSTKF